MSAAPSVLTDNGPARLKETLARHARMSAEFAREAEGHEQRGVRLSWLRLTTFLTAVVVLYGAWHDRSWLLAALGLAAVLGFVVAVFAHGRTLSAQNRALCRRDVHDRHSARTTHAWTQFPRTGEHLVARDHAYAWDIDLVGHGSLFQRIDVTHTCEGEQTLVSWLASATDTETARARQAAVLELRDMLELRRELEAAVPSGAAAASAAKGKDEKLAASRVQALAQAPQVFAGRAWLTPVMLILPAITLICLALSSAELLPKGLWLLPVLVQTGVLIRLGPEVQRLMDVVLAKTPALEAYKEMLVLAENARFQTPVLQALQARLQVGGRAPSAQLSRLAFWVGLAELRENFLFHVVFNSLVLWDLHVARGIEGFVRDVGTGMDAWFSVLAELEALCSLATLAELDPAATMPELLDEHAALTAQGLLHPLLPAGSRVANDVRLHGPASALVVTGSNMAGKSTLLRAVGQNIVLALAGGPVTAEQMCVPRVRLRASMRANDSLEAGSSYFHAELQKLKCVIEHAEASPPVFFLLDELLRGTNARARHLGAKAVLLHLLQRSATGLCATHDVELAALAYDRPKQIENIHFTDVMIGGEMVFDYRVRPGIVRTSNALRLLAMAGVDVPLAERESLEIGATHFDQPTPLQERQEPPPREGEVLE